jgi:hypothetical protein
MKFSNWRPGMAQVMFGVVVIIFCLGAAWRMPDEGMWTFDNPPLQQLKERYGFTPARGFAALCGDGIGTGQASAKPDFQH